MPILILKENNIINKIIKKYKNIKNIFKYLTNIYCIIIYIFYDYLGIVLYI